MNKKSIISLFTGAALMFSMPSCTDLDETVYDKIPAENFGKTDGEINSIIGPAYNTFKRYFSDACIALSECSGDMAVVLPVKVVTGMMVVSIVSYTCTHGLRIPQP